MKAIKTVCAEISKLHGRSEGVNKDIVINNINGTNFSAPKAHFNNQVSSIMLETKIFENLKLIKRMKIYKPKRKKKYSQNRARNQSFL